MLDADQTGPAELDIDPYADAVVGFERTKLQIAHIKLSHSRAFSCRPNRCRTKRCCSTPIGAHSGSSAASGSTAQGGRDVRLLHSDDIAFCSERQCPRQDFQFTLLLGHRRVMSIRGD